MTELYIVVGRHSEERSGLFIVAICDSKGKANLAKRRSNYREVFILGGPDECYYTGGKYGGKPFMLNEVYGPRHDETYLAELGLSENICQNFYDKDIVTVSELCKVSDGDMIDLLDDPNDFYEVLDKLHDKEMHLNHEDERLSSIGLATSTIEYLVDRGIKNLHTLCSYSERRLQEDCNITVDVENDIIDCLSSHNLSLSNPEDDVETLDLPTEVTRELLREKIFTIPILCELPDYEIVWIYHKGYKWKDITAKVQELGTRLTRYTDRLVWIGIPANIIYGLSYRGICDVSDLCLFDEHELLKFHKFGRKSLNKVKECLYNHNLSLAGASDYDEAD